MLISWLLKGLVFKQSSLRNGLTKLRLDSRVKMVFLFLAILAITIHAPEGPTETKSPTPQFFGGGLRLASLIFVG